MYDIEFYYLRSSKKISGIRKIIDIKWLHYKRLGIVPVFWLL
jgi:hypothetical protein